MPLERLLRSGGIASFWVLEPESDELIFTVEQPEPFEIVTADDVRSRLEAGTPIEPWRTPPLPYPHGPERRRDRPRRN